MEEYNDRFNCWEWTVIDSILSAGKSDVTPDLLKRANEHFSRSKINTKSVVEHYRCNIYYVLLKMSITFFC